MASSWEREEEQEGTCVFMDVELKPRAEAVWEVVMVKRALEVIALDVSWCHPEYRRWGERNCYIPWWPSLSWGLQTMGCLWKDSYSPGGKSMDLHWAGFSNASARTHLPEHVAIKKQISIGNHGLRPTEYERLCQRKINARYAIWSLDAQCPAQSRKMKLEFQWAGLAFPGSWVATLIAQSSFPADFAKAGVSAEASLWFGKFSFESDSLLRLGCYLPKTWLWFSLLRKQIWKITKRRVFE